VSDQELIEAAKSARRAMVQIGLALRPIVEDVQAIGRRPVARPDCPRCGTGHGMYAGPPRSKKWVCSNSGCRHEWGDAYIRRRVKPA
jgi:transposase